MATILPALLVGTGCLLPTGLPCPVPPAPAPTGAAAALAAVAAAVAVASPRADSLYETGVRDGSVDAAVAPVRRDLARGLGWSLVGGPVGGVVAVRRGRSAPLPVPAPREPALDELGPVYRDGYHHGFRIVFQPRRKQAAVLGSLVGSTVWAFAILRVIDLPGRAEETGETNGGEPTFTLRFALPLGAP